VLSTGKALGLSFTAAIFTKGRATAALGKKGFGQGAGSHSRKAARFRSYARCTISFNVSFLRADRGRRWPEKTRLRPGRKHSFILENYSAGSKATRPLLRDLGPKPLVVNFSINNYQNSKIVARSCGRFPQHILAAAAEFSAGDHAQSASATLQIFPRRATKYIRLRRVRW